VEVAAKVHAKSTQAADASATGSTAEEKPAPKKRLANEPEESKVTSAVH
jgi:hypothetical protein